MTRRICLAALSVIVAAGLALAQEKKGGETKTATGTVKAVSADSLTVVKGTDEWTFTVDKNTRIVAKGATRKTAKAKQAGEALVITDIVKEKQSVTVEYHEINGKRHAAEVRIR